MPIRRSASAEAAFTPSATFNKVEVKMTPTDFIRSQPSNLTPGQLKKLAKEAGVDSFHSNLVYNVRARDKARAADKAQPKAAKRKLLGYVVRKADGSLYSDGKKDFAWVLAYRYGPTKTELEAAEDDAKKLNGRVVKIWGVAP